MNGVDDAHTTITIPLLEISLHSIPSALKQISQTSMQHEAVLSRFTEMEQTIHESDGDGTITITIIITITVQSTHDYGALEIRQRFMKQSNHIRCLDNFAVGAKLNH